MSVLSEMEALADRYSPEIPIPSPATIEQVRRNLELRVSLLTEFGAVSADEVAELVGSEAKRPSATVENWRRSNRVVAVRWRNQTLVPGFQLLSDGQPDGNLRPVLKVLRDQGFSDWAAALWWVLPSPGLGGGRPVDLLLGIREDGERVSEGRERLVRAARRRRDWF